ncbi:adhesion and penetration autotransporter App [Neisseria gonorrhoeae]|uniref:adhesion and penetration autotransporter App n=1 Tax=Neisseria gonorrhoeae TaxID=485 RepID=UPI0001BD82FB|nr:adhesion and penetration autotransporter App [Neisseria gonorrhoeae]KLS00664.1 adhesin [Neisseria gonorrhoeae SK14515]ANJ53319.1 autotransporter outer membrane beta-barrel domain-containing protein [Neisseria gonorrhoeae]ARB99648.1 autotransporter outer membrane beta-barrel domain-containing protein [Neisseria gonorrhoeae]ARC00712.1 autotransporter outer membrane beta-barrel domain-containing protein [Neisseria gonorrhoeae]EEZ46889.1 adhesion and penetration protein [Neisseria gonorrhoeae M
MKTTDKRTTETHRKAPKTGRIRFSPAYLAICLSFGILPQARAGHTYFGINYQYYRDFAENKGKFAVGAKDIEVYNKKGELVGKSMTKAPMIDFSVVSRNGVAALAGDQYIVSVAHNGGYNNVDFGAEGSNPDQHRFSYQIVKRNNYKAGTNGHPYGGDYHMPRLHKFVTDAEPVEMTSYMDGWKYADLNKYPDRVRIGAGRQYWRSDEDEPNNRESSYHIASAYSWLVGGNTFAQNGSGGGTVNLGSEKIKHSPYGFLPTGGSFGDSGSPMFIYDAQKQKWLINGVLQTGNPYIGKSNGFQLVRKDWFYDEIFAGDTHSVFYEPHQNGKYFFNDNNNGAGKIDAKHKHYSLPYRLKTRTVQLFNVSLSETAREPVYHAAGGVNSYRPRLNNGENISFIDKGKGELILTSNINQGAGGLYFEGNFTVSPKNNETWQGAGVHISDGSTVTWKVNGVANDRLSKIGKGTLLVQAKGENQGSVSVGDGKVILDQQADDQGKKQAFSEIGLVSGRGTVQLNADNQFNPDKLYFGFRGGRLDLNGHSLSFHRIQNTDEGAMIVNHNQDKESTVTITGNKDITTTGNNNNLDSKKEIAYNGWFGEKDATKTNGRLNLNYQPEEADRTLLLSGGTNLNGNITQTNGKLFFSGRPTPHAYNHLGSGWSKMEGIPQGEIVWDNDWIDRTFKAENFHIQGGQAVVSRNVAKVEGDWHLSNHAQAVFGVAPHQSHTICTRSDWTGLTSCTEKTITDDKVIASLSKTDIRGNVSLADHAHLNLTGLATLNGNLSAGGDTHYTVTRNATQNGNLSLVGNAQATFNQATLNGNTSASDNASFNLSNNAVQNGSLTLSDNAKANVSHSALNGNVSLADKAVFHFENSRFTGKISGGKDTALHLKDSEWTLPSGTELGNLNLDNATITLNSAYRHDAAGAQTGSAADAPRRRSRRSLLSVTPPTSAESRFNTLTVNGKLNGQGTFRFMSELFGYRSGKLKLAESSEGTYTLAVNNTGNEPVSLEQLTVVEGKDNTPLSENLNFTLQNEHVDAGAWRYQLIRKDGEFRLHNPVKEQELSDKLGKAGETEAALTAKQAQLAAKQQAEKDNAQSLDALIAAGRDATEKAESVAEPARQAGGENAGIMQAEEEKKRVQADKDTALAKQREAETRPATTAFPRARRARRDLPQPQPQPQRDLISRYANSGLSEFSATLNSVFAVQDELDRVFAEDRRNAVWTSGIRDTKHYRSQDFRAYRQQTDLRQIGMQKNLGSGRVGILFSHNRTGNTFDDGIGNSARLAHGAVFGQYGIGRFDIGISAGAGFSSGSLSDGIRGKIRRRVLHYGIQARYRAGFGGFGIEPHIGATRYFVQKADYRYENVNIATPGLAFNRYRAGIKADYSFKPAQHISITPYLSLSYTDAASGKVRTRVNTAVLAQDFGKTRSAEWGVNAEIKGFTLSLHAAAAKGPQLEAQHSAGIKLGYRW